MFSLVSMLGTMAPEIGVVDVGARMTSEEDIDYRALVKAGVARVVGFEPDPAECARLNAMGLRGQRFLPYFLGDGRPGTFRICANGLTSSLYEPNQALLSLFNGLAPMSEVQLRERVRTKRLDDIADLGSADYIKIDVQGAELDVLRGAEKTLGGTLVVHVEVEFVPMYVGQPLFADVDAFLRGRGFMFHKFASVWGWPVRPFEGPTDHPSRQLLWADAVYVRDVMGWNALHPPALLKLAVILHEVYGSHDLAALALERYDGATGAGLWGRYAASFSPPESQQR